MTDITLKNKVTNASHILVLTTTFTAEFGLPDKVNDYLAAKLKEEGVKTLTYNYIGKYISILLVDPAKEKKQP